MGKRHYRRYTDRDKAAALAHLRSGRGVLNEAARDLGIPYETLRGWAAGRHLSPEVAAEFGVVRDELSARIEEVIYEAIDAMPEKIEGASLKEVGTVVAQLVDKLKLLWDTPATTTESVCSEAAECESMDRRAMLERLIQRTMEQFPGMTREEVIDIIRDLKPEAIKLLS
ncbi:MAG TPA: hypothetical protein VKJ45_18940 [Blastocatellia bacterium]|nr:hypothetical protein [Blastocatellia bacterium]